MSNVNMIDLVAERIKESALGELIKEEDLYDIVKEGIERAFFKDREKHDGYRSQRIEPLIVEIVRDAMKAHVEDMVRRWVAENSEALHEHMTKVMDKGIVQYAEQVIEARVHVAQRPALQSMLDALNQERRDQGLPDLPVFLPYLGEGR